MSVAAGRAARPFVLDEREFTLVARQDHAGLHVWLERPGGQVWMPVSEPLPEGHGLAVDLFHEIVALTFDDPETIVEEVGQRSGWFEPTGRTVAYPRNQQNEVWRLTPACLALIRPPNVTARIHRLLDHAAPGRMPPAGCLDGVARSLLGRVRCHGYSALAMARPDVLSACEGPVQRVLAVATSAPLFHHAHEVLRSAMPGGELVTSVDALSAPPPWQGFLQDLGYRHALVVRVPVAATASYDFLLCSTSACVTDSRRDGAALEVLRAWPTWRETVQREICPLSAREREALQALASGLTGAEASLRLDCSERTFRMHSDNARRKLRAANGTQAVHRAHLLCAW